MLSVRLSWYECVAVGVGSSARRRWRGGDCERSWSGGGSDRLVVWAERACGSGGSLRLVRGLGMVASIGVMAVER